jgi:hypothetical protein
MRTTTTTTTITGKAHQILIFSLLLFFLSMLITFVRQSELDRTKIYPICFLGTPPSQFAVGPSSSSPRASIPSNNSASPTSGINGLKKILFSNQLII